MSSSAHQEKVLVLGGGFGGVRLAQILGRSYRFAVRLMDPKSYMDYHAAVYRLTAGGSATEVCLPYARLLRGTAVEVVRDTASFVDLSSKKVTGKSGSVYSYDRLVFALGAVPSYFGIEGVERHAFGIESAQSSLRLRRHIHDCFMQARTSAPKEAASLLHVAIIGGGASGVELAGQLAWYAKNLSAEHGLSPSLVCIDLIEAMPRLLPFLPERLSTFALQRLRSLGVNVYLNRSVVRESFDTLFLSDIQMTLKTVVWTAGLRGHALASSTPGLTLDQRGKIIVDGFLHAAGQQCVYAIGDIASTKYSGMAQTALADAEFLARSLHEPSVVAYRQPEPSYAVPVGPGQAAVHYRGMCFTGRIGWVLRRAADFLAFISLLPALDAFSAFLGGFASEEE